MTIFFTSDTHFGHKNIIDYCKRPFADVEEMNESMVKQWNEAVKPGDVVYHLGDVAFHSYECIERLNGKIKLVPGNHDHERAKKVMHLFDEVLPEVHYLRIDKRYRFALCHYPFESWRREYKYHLHGHMHGAGRARYNRLDVGVDALKSFAPLCLDEVMERMTENNLAVEELNK
jgi:calcineurin-like phosphoesterase family protein